MNNLKQVAEDVFIIAHKENTDALENELEGQGFRVRVFRKGYTEEEMLLAGIVRCFLNHLDAWREIKRSGRNTIVVEADFVPVQRFSQLTAPFDPARSPNSVAWLYGGGSVLYRFDSLGYPIGHSSCTVAMLIGAPAAEALIAIAEEELQGAAPGQYIPLETYLSHKLRRGKGVNTYIPFRQYGEHGGKPNPEHHAHGVRGWHQADVLAGRLAFLPEYARGSYAIYLGYRFRASLRGLLRVLLWKFLEWQSFKDSRDKTRLLKFAFSRWIPGATLSWWVTSWTERRAG